MEQREQSQAWLELCRVATEEDESQIKEILEICRFAPIVQLCRWSKATIIRSIRLNIYLCFRIIRIIREIRSRKKIICGWSPFLYFLYFLRDIETSAQPSAGSVTSSIPLLS
jgi:hypothetical protein